MTSLRLLSACVALCLALTARAQDYSSLYQDLPVALEQPQLPQIPERRVSVLDYGAAGDGTTLCTSAFAEAIKALSEAGGGHLEVPAGVYLTGPISLRSHIDLHIMRGALVIFTPDKRAYFDGKATGRAKPCISAEKCTDISITGEGILDGNGKFWRYAKKEKMSDTEWKDLRRLGGRVTEDGKLWFPAGLNHFQDLTDDPEKEESLRQHMIVVKRCERVLINGVTVQNSPKFHINPSQCSDVILDGVTVRCPWNAQNGDGIDIGNSRRVLVTRCLVDVGDDGICMKGGSGQKGLEAGPCQDILICDNTVFHGHGGFVLGSDISGGMDRIVVHRCTFSGTDIGLRFKSAPSRGGKCSDIWISDISMNDIRDAAVSFSCDYSDVSYKTLSSGSGSDFVPDFTDIHISHVTCRECDTAIYAKGIKGMKCIHGISLSDCSFFYTRKDTEIDGESAEISLEKVSFRTF